MEVVSYDRVMQLQNTVNRQRRMIEEHLEVREQMRKVLGFDLEDWKVFMDQCHRSTEFSREELDPVVLYGAIVQCCTKIVTDSGDIFARTVAEEIIKTLNPIYVLSITGEEPDVTNL